MFCEHKLVVIKAGRGGSGCNAFTRGNRKRICQPDGGTGGNGGHLYLQASQDCLNLKNIKSSVKAQHGQNGSVRGLKGCSGASKVITVPLNTYCYDDQYALLIDHLTHHNQKILIAEGGQGGLGNIDSKKFNSMPGKEGVTRCLKLSHYWCADIAIMGHANTGKSTLFNYIVGEEASKVAYHPYTTLSVVRRQLSSENWKQSYLIVDTPPVETFRKYCCPDYIYGKGTIIYLAFNKEHYNFLDQMITEKLILPRSVWLILLSRGLHARDSDFLRVSRLESLSLKQVAVVIKKDFLL